jgi:hypothetical protein
MGHAPDKILPIHRLFLDRPIFRFAVFAIILLLLLSFFTPLQLHFAQEGLDPSWRLALVEARKQGLHFGSQVIFTGGPLSHVYSHIYDKSLTHEKFIAAAIFISFFAVIFRSVIFSSRNLLVACVAVMPFVFNLFDDPIFLGIPLAASLAIISSRSRPERAALLLLGPVASATMTLAKFSVFPMAIAGFLLADVAALSQRRLPLGLIIYAVCLSIGFALTSPGASLVEFIQSSLDVAAGYAEAMGTWGPWHELVPVCAFAAGCLATIVTFEIRSLRASSVSKTISTCRIACVGAYLFLCMKAGLVPHGVHQAILWYGISFVAAIYAALIVASTSFAVAATSPATSLSHRSLWILTAFVLAGLCGGQTWLAQQTGHVNSDLLLRQAILPYQRISQWIDFLRQPEPWLAVQERKSLEALRQLRDKYPLPPLEGAVDIIPSFQSSVIANGLKYDPRPSVQEYATYTHRLIEKNRAFIRSDRAPAYLLMVPSSVLGRHPAAAEGAMWPDFLSRYTPVDTVGIWIVLRRRDQPIDIPLSRVRTETVELNSLVTMDSIPPGAVFAKIDVQPTINGRIANILFKSALIYIDINYADGTQSSYRLVPAMAREGFFISPAFESSQDYLALALGRLREENKRTVKSFLIRTDSFGDWLWDSKVTVTLDVLDDKIIRDNVDTKKIMSSSLRRNIELLQIFDRSRADSKVSMMPAGLFAHAPTWLTIETNRSKSLRIGFGILDSAWQGEAKTQGACFSVMEGNSLTAMFSRCLNPMEEQADRGEQTAEIALPDEITSLVLGTTCRNRVDCGWPWSYWGQVSLRDESPTSSHETGQQDKIRNR